MMAPTHVVVGVGAYALTSISTQDPVTPVLLGAAALGALAPDIDCPASWLGRRTFPLSLLFGWFAGHRGITHSLFALFLVCLAAVFLVPSALAGAGFAFIVGYMSHLLADWNTSSGVPFFWPSEKRIRAPWSFPTGSLTEMAICATFGLILLAWTGMSVQGMDLHAKAQEAGRAINQYVRDF